MLIHVNFMIIKRKFYNIHLLENWNNSWLTEWSGASQPYWTSINSYNQFYDKSNNQPPWQSCWVSFCLFGMHKFQQEFNESMEKFIQCFQNFKDYPLLNIKKIINLDFFNSLAQIRNVEIILRVY